MNIIYITSRLPFASGESFLIPELTALRELGHTVELIPLYPRGQAIHDCTNAADTVFSGPLYTWVNPKSMLHLFSGSRGAKVVRELLSQSSGERLPKTLAACLKGIWVGEHVARHPIDHIHCHWAAATASMAMVASAVSGIPWSMTAHRWDIAVNDSFTLKAKSASFVRFISKRGMDTAAKFGPLAVTGGRVIHMGVRVPEVSSRRPTRNQLVFLCPANLVPVKGHQYLIASMRSLQSRGVACTLWLAGEGELRSRLEAAVQDAGVSHCTRFLGALPHERLLRLYAEGCVDAVVLPSLDLGNGLHEGIPVSLMEAMSYSIPVISTRTGGIPELISSGTGILVPPADSAALTEAMLTLIDSPERREQFGREGSERVRQCFSVTSMAQQLSCLFQQHSASVGSNADETVGISR